jgi:DNA invertase Pin-like site-specific DNA recombinase
MLDPYLTEGVAMTSTGQKIGYARVSTTDQSTDVQVEQLEAAGCTKVFSEQVTGTSTTDRTQLAAALDYAREGDTLVVCRLDRLARSQADLHRLLSELTAKGIAFECTEQPQVNTTGPMGKLLLGVLGAVAEFETELRRERQMEGVAKAKAAGKYKGRQPLKAEKVEKLKAMVEAGSSISAAAREIGISRVTAHKYL